MIWLRIETSVGVESLCEYSNEPSGSIECWGVIGYLHN
jgi:hypothetical protein